MRGIKIPQQDFALKMQGGLCARGGGGSVFAGHYGIYYITRVICFASLGVTSLYMCGFNYLISIFTGILVGTPSLQQGYSKCN